MRINLNGLIRMYLGAIVVFVLTAAPCYSAEAGNVSERISSINRSIDQISIAINDDRSRAPLEVRKITFGTLFGNKSNDAAALFSVEAINGGNTSVQYIATFTPISTRATLNTSKYRLVTLDQVGETGWRLYGNLKIERNKIILEGQQWVNDDKDCCPSKTINSELVLESRGTSSVAVHEVP